MTFNASSKVAGRKPLVIVEIDMDLCANVYSEAPCTANGAGGSECFNTFATCQDPANYNKTTKTYRFSERDRKLPLAALDAIPCIESVKTAAATLTPGKGLGARASVTVEMMDLAHNDRGIDPYVTRTEAEEVGENLVKWSGDTLQIPPWSYSGGTATRENVPAFYDHPDVDALRVTATTVSSTFMAQIMGDFSAGGWNVWVADVERTPTSGTTRWGVRNNTLAQWIGLALMTWDTGVASMSTGVGTPYAFNLGVTGPNGGEMWRLVIVVDASSVVDPSDARWGYIYPNNTSPSVGDSLILHHFQFMEFDHEPTSDEVEDLPVIVTNATPAPLTRAIIAGRPYDPLERGTFWGKFKARNPFYFGRTLRVLEGYADEPFSLSNFETRQYIIETIDGPDASGRVRIVAKDILKKTALDRAQWPLASDGKLASDINDTTTTIPLAVGYSTTYTDDHIRIGDEIIDVSGATFASDEWTNVVRGAGGTEAKDHKADDSVQDCATYSSVNVIDIVKELLEDGASIPPAFIPYAEWEDERDLSLLSFNLSTIISNPTSVELLLNELVEQVLLELYWDETAQVIRLRHETQWIEDAASLNDTDHLLASATTPRDRHDIRLSRVWVYYDPINFANDLKSENFRRLAIRVDTESESANEFDDIKVRKIYSRWFGAANDTAANLLTQRLLGRFGDTPKEITFELDASRESEQRLGDVVSVKSYTEQLEDGSPATVRFQITSVEAVQHAHRYRYKGIRYGATPAPELTIAANTTNYNVFDELGQPPGPVDVVLTINAGVVVSGEPAITTDGLHPSSSVLIINNGTIEGYGGVGGDGGGGSCVFEEGQWLCIGGFGEDGAPGEDALEITVPTTIDNTNGNIFAGGGGGGGGGGTADEGVTTGGAGGSGGRGRNDPAGGTGGLGTGGDVNNPGPSGNPGDETAPGAAVGNGGAGGDWGEDGDAGTVGNPNAAGGDGGDAGRAVVTNGNPLNWTGGNNPTQVKGAVV